VVPGRGNEATSARPKSDCCIGVEAHSFSSVEVVAEKTVSEHNRIGVTDGQVHRGQKDCTDSVVVDSRGVTVTQSEPYDPCLIPEKTRHA
jgi:hypothetical protein